MLIDLAADPRASGSQVSNARTSSLRLRSLETFEKAADRKATRICIPSETASMAGLAREMKETVKNDEIK